MGTELNAFTSFDSISGPQARPGPHRLETISNSFQDTYADGIRLIFNPEMIRLLQTYTGVSWNAQLELLEYKVSYEIRFYSSKPD